MYTSAKVPALIATAELGLDASPVGGHDRVLTAPMNLLAQVALKVNQLRNKASDGHGQATAVTGLDLRHSRLAVRASLALCAFMLRRCTTRTPTARRRTLTRPRHGVCLTSGPSRGMLKIYGSSASWLKLAVRIRGCGTRRRSGKAPPPVWLHTAGIQADYKV